MAETIDLAQMVRELVEPLVEYPEDLSVTESETAEGSALVEIDVHEDDVGKVIGRQGRVIKAVRTLARAAGSRHGLSVEVELID